MRTTRFHLDGGVLGTTVEDPGPFVTLDSYAGDPLKGVRVHEIAVSEGVAGLELQHVEIAAGGEFAMHSSPHLAFCHIVRGSGSLSLPDGRVIPYRGPETFVFEPNTEHAWQQVDEETLLAVAIVPIKVSR